MMSRAVDVLLHGYLNGEGCSMVMYGGSLGDGKAGKHEHI